MVRPLNIIISYSVTSFLNALVEGYTAVRSMGMFIKWLLYFCTYEVEIRDEYGEMIHYFPQLNFDGDDNDFR